MTTERQIILNDVRMGEGHAFDTRLRVRFPVEPPTHTTPEGQWIRLIDEEGWIEVTCTKDGAVLIRGAHALRFEPESSNSVVVRLLDAGPRR